MNARSEGDETPLWLDPHACRTEWRTQRAPKGTQAWLCIMSKDARTGPKDARTGPKDARTGPKDTRTGPKDTRTGPKDTRVLASHSECIVVRSRAFMNNPG